MRRSGGEVKQAEVSVDQPPTVAFTAFADAWPRAIETEIGAALYIYIHTYIIYIRIVFN